MKYYLSYTGTKYPMSESYQFHYVEKITYGMFDNVHHSFGISDYLVSFLKPCGQKSAIEHINYINSNYVILIEVDKLFIPIKQILEN